MDTEIKRKRFIRETRIATGRYPVIRFSSFAKVNFVIPRHQKDNVIGHILSNYGEVVRVYSSVDFNDGFIGYCLILCSLDNEADVLTFLALCNVVYNFEELPNRGYVVGLPNNLSVKEEVLLQNQLLFFQQSGFKIHRHKIRWLEAFNLQSYKKLCDYFRQRCIQFESFPRAYYTDPTKTFSDIAYISPPPNRSQDEQTISFFENYDYENEETAAEEAAAEDDLPLSSQQTDANKQQTDENVKDSTTDFDDTVSNQRSTGNAAGNASNADTAGPSTSQPNVRASHSTDFDETDSNQRSAGNDDTGPSTSQQNVRPSQSTSPRHFDLSQISRRGQRRIFDVLYESEEEAARRAAQHGHPPYIGVKDVDFIGSDESLDNALMAVDLVVEDSVESVYNHPSQPQNNPHAASDRASPMNVSPLPLSTMQRNTNTYSASVDSFGHLSSSTYTDSRRTRSLPNQYFSSYAHLLTCSEKLSRSLPNLPSTSANGPLRRLRSLPNIQRPASENNRTHAKSKKTRRCLSEAPAFHEDVPDTQADMFLSLDDIEVGDDDVFLPNNSDVAEDIKWVEERIKEGRAPASASSGTTIPASANVAKSDSHSVASSGSTIPPSGKVAKSDSGHSASSGSTIPPSGKVAKSDSEESVQETREGISGEKSAEISTQSVSTYKRGTIELSTIQQAITGTQSDVANIDWATAEKVETSEESEEDAGTRVLFSFYPQSGDLVNTDTCTQPHLIPSINSSSATQGTVFPPTHSVNSLTTTSNPVTIVSSISTMKSVLCPSKGESDSQHVIVVKNQSRLILTDGRSVSLSPIPCIPPQATQSPNDSPESCTDFIPVSLSPIPRIPPQTQSDNDSAHFSATEFIPLLSPEGSKSPEGSEENYLLNPNVTDQLNTAMIQSPQNECVVSISDAERAAKAVLSQPQLSSTTDAPGESEKRDVESTETCSLPNPLCASTQKQNLNSADHMLHESPVASPSNAPTQILTPEIVTESSDSVLEVAQCRNVNSNTQPESFGPNAATQILSTESDNNSSQEDCMSRTGSDTVHAPLLRALLQKGVRKPKDD